MPAARTDRRSETPAPKLRDYYRAESQDREAQQPQQKPYQLGPRLRAQQQQVSDDTDKFCGKELKQTPCIVVDHVKLKKVRGQRVDYYSASNQCWLPATIVKVDNETGEVFLDLNPGVALTLRDQKKKMRPRTLPSEQQVSNVAMIINDDQVHSTASDFFHTVASGPGSSISRQEDLDELGLKVDSFMGLTGSKVHFKNKAKGRQGLTLECFEDIFRELIQIQQEISVRAIPRNVADKCVEGLPDEKYDLGETLGTGSFGTVVCATDKITRQRRAIKIIDKKVCGNKLENMKVEIQHLTELDHPHILKLHEFYNSETSLYLVTDFCSGGELHDRIVRTKKDCRTIPEAWVADVMHQLMLAISHIHACGILHLDLKSQNIMLMPSLKTKQHFDRPCEDGGYEFSFAERPHIMVIDLGVATLFKPGNFKLGRPTGTPATMAPEVWKGVITPAADVFSSGCVLFELLCFEMPWVWKPKDFTQAVQFWSTHPQAAWDKVRLVNPEAQMLLASMLEQDRKKRIGAPECLASAFLKPASRKCQTHGQAEQERRTQLLRRLSTVHHRDGLYNNIALKIAKDWPPNQMPSFKRLFAELDVAGTGVLSEKQLAESLVKLGGVDAPTAKRAATAMNMNKDTAAVDWTEFVAACIDLSKTDFQPAILNIFKTADKDDDGLLSARDLEGMLPAVHAYSREAAKHMFVNLTGRWSEDGGERVDWNTFVTHLWTQARAGISDKRSNQSEVAQESMPDSMSHILLRLEEMGFANRELNERIIKANQGILTDSALQSIIAQSVSPPDSQRRGSVPQTTAFQPPSRVPISGSDLAPVIRTRSAMIRH